jgi:hypothetical protein
MRSPFDGIGRRSPFGVLRGGGVASFWDAYPAARLHDTDNVTSMPGSVGANSTGLIDVSGNGLPGYLPLAGTGHPIQSVNGHRVLIGAGTSIFRASGFTNLRGTESFYLVKVGASNNKYLVKDSTITYEGIRVGSGAQRLEVLFLEADRYGTSNILGATLPLGTWTVIRAVVTNTNGAQIYVNDALYASATGVFSADGTATYNMDQLGLHEGTVGYHTIAVFDLVSDAPRSTSDSAAITSYLMGIRAEIIG